MPSAIQERRRASGHLVDPSGYERGAELVDINGFLLDVATQAGVHLDIDESITSGYIERTMDGATTLEVTVFDPHRELLHSGLFGDGTHFRYDVSDMRWRDEDPRKSHFKTIDVKLDGLWFRLVQVQKQGDNVVLTFEDRIVAYLKLHNRPRKASRGGMTRAEFVRMLVQEVKAQEIRFYSPDLHKKQPIKKRKKQRERRSNRDPGLLLATDITVKHRQATKNQIQNIQDILDTGASMNANKKVMMSAIMTATQESSITTTATNGSHIGIFQQDSKPGSVWRQRGGASRNAIHDAKAYFIGAIASDQNNPSQSVAELCESVQHSGLGAKATYGQWQSEAKTTVNEYLGGGGGGGVSTQTVTFNKKFEFHRGPPDGPHKENTWDCTYRLAGDVNWRRFVVGNTFFYVDDEQLMRSAPQDILDESDDGIDTIDWDLDSGKVVAEATVECRANRWFARPGEVIKLKNQGPANGRWLVWTIHRDLFSPSCTITLRQPESAKPEPAPERASTSTNLDTSGVVGGGRIRDNKHVRARIIQAAELAASYNSSKYDYAEVRPYPRSLFMKGRVRTDCSGFATLCYRAGGAPDPNDAHYNGSGNTTTLQDQGTGRKVSRKKLQAADLVFYSNPDHVGVYDGNGYVIEFGSQGGPRKVPVNYRTITNMLTYDLGTPGTQTPAPVNPYDQGAPQTTLGPH